MILFFDRTTARNLKRFVIVPPSGYQHLEIIAHGRSTWGGGTLVSIGLILNGDRAENYAWQADRAQGGTGHAFTPTPLSAAAGGMDEHRSVVGYVPAGPLTDPHPHYRGHARILIPHYAHAGIQKQYSSAGGAIWDFGVGSFIQSSFFGAWKQPYGPEGINEIELELDLGDWAPGSSVQAYGY